MPKTTGFTAFYSYKGGVGRSLMLANLAYLLAYQGRKVLIIDLDLEAPGQHATDLFSDALSGSVLRPKCVMDLLEDYRTYRKGLRKLSETTDKTSPYEWRLRDYMMHSSVFDDRIAQLEQAQPDHESNESDEPNRGTIWLMPATGKQEDELLDYQSQLARWDWGRFYQEDSGAAFFDGG